MKLPERVYHLAEAANWPIIQRAGLLAASSLIEAAGLKGAARARLERMQRVTHTELPSKVQIRDQRPMPAKALQSCLRDMSPAEWYAMVNRRVFFWFDPERLNRQRRACEPRPQVVITVDTQALIAEHKDRIAVTPINTGNARRKPARRGAATFVSLKDWMSSGWASEYQVLGGPARPRSHRPVELTVLHSVPDIMRYVVSVSELLSGQLFVPSLKMGSRGLPQDP